VTAGARWLAVMLVSTNLTYGGYTVIGQGMTWVECYALIASVGAGAFIDHAGHLRIRECLAEPGDPDQ
jgi:hypothetical protein